MKRFLRNSLLLTVIGMMVTSCAEEPIGTTWAPSFNARYLQMSTTNMNFGSNSNLTQTLNVKATTTSWKFTGYDAWLAVTPASGNSNATVSVTAQENTSGDAIRTSLFSFASTASDYTFTKRLTATQSAATPFITPALSSLAIPGSAYSQPIAISSNIAWTVTSSATWLTATATKASTIILAAQENTTGNSRSATITLKGETKTSTTTTITVIQAPAHITESDSILWFYNTGGTYQFKIHSEAAWTATTAQEWIQVLPDHGNAGEMTLTISATPNGSVSERTGYVIFKISSTQQIQLTVKQKGIYIETADSALNFTSFEGSQTLTLLSNTDWKIIEKPSWVSVSPTSGNGNQQLTVTVNNNPNTTARSGALIIGQEGTTLQATVQITQEAKTFDPEAFATMTFTDKASTDTLSFTTDGTWTAATPQSWIKLSTVAGTGNGKIAVSVTENTDEDMRTGEIAVTVGATTRTALVQQSGKYFTVTTGTTATLPSTGGTHHVSFNTNDTWKATTCSSWITLTPDAGSESATLAIKAADNPSINTRIDTTLITPSHTQGIKVITTQAARYLKIDLTQVNFFAAGGTSNAITITTDATYNITCSDTWFSVQQDGNTFTVTAEKYEGKTLRKGTITIAMTGLVGGESYALQLPVVQSGEGAIFSIRPFAEDVNWNVAGGTGATFTITGFGTDNNWNPAGTSSLNVIVNGYPNDENWNF